MEKKNNGFFNIVESIKQSKEEREKHKRIHERLEYAREKIAKEEREKNDKIKKESIYRNNILKHALELAHELGKVDGEYNEEGDFTPHKYEYQFDHLKIIHDYYYQESDVYNKYGKNERVFVYVGDELVLEWRGNIKYFAQSNWPNLIEMLYQKLPALKKAKKKEDEERNDKKRYFRFLEEAFKKYELIEGNDYYFKILTELLKKAGIFIKKDFFKYELTNNNYKVFRGYVVYYRNKQVLLFPVAQDRYKVKDDYLLDMYKPTSWENFFINGCNKAYSEYMNRNINKVNREVNKSLEKLNKM